MKAFKVALALTAALACCPPKDPQVIQAIQEKQREACRKFCASSSDCVLNFRPTAAPIAPLCECVQCVTN